MRVERFDLVTADLGELAMALVDASTLLLGSPAMLNGLHPLAVQAAYLVNILKPKFKFAAAFGSYGWGAKALENIPALLPDLQPEFLGQIFCKGLPKAADLEALDRLANAVAEKHRPTPA
ncbi:MAG: hypothetical protein BWK77_04060 [Verrucomicrobia bacterium A1]|nr:MAG: hypothetical protein BWK77_04060 [Verrucomicrobia bacterium A1]